MHYCHEIFELLEIRGSSEPPKPPSYGPEYTSDIGYL